MSQKDEKTENGIKELLVSINKKLGKAEDSLNAISYFLLIEWLVMCIAFGFWVIR